MAALQYSMRASQACIASADCATSADWPAGSWSPSATRSSVSRGLVDRTPAPAADAGLHPASLLSLTVREFEVVTLLLGVHTAEEAARMLGVGLTTVRTHQYRAFRRLGCGL